LADIGRIDEGVREETGATPQDGEEKTPHGEMKMW
jgi:hypothetical protein